MRIMAPLLKRRFLTQTTPAGFQFPDRIKPQVDPNPTISTADGLDALRFAVSRCQSESHRAPHPFLGKLSKDDWDRFNLRHAELHMSFVVPADE